MPVYVDQEQLNQSVTELTRQEEMEYKHLAQYICRFRKCYMCGCPYDILNSTGILCQNDMDHYDPQTEHGDLHISYRVFQNLERQGATDAPGWKRIKKIKKIGEFEPTEVILPRNRELSSLSHKHEEHTQG
jgi:hypothetical protein